MTHIEHCRCDAGPFAAHRGDTPNAWRPASMVRTVCPVLPDVEEERMLRALVSEGVSMFHRGP